MLTDTEVQYGDSASAARAIHSALDDLSAAPVGHKITEKRFTWAAGQIATMAAYDGVTLLFTLTFTWNADGTLQKVVRT